MFADPWLKELYDRGIQNYKNMGTVFLGVGFHHLNDNAFSEWLYDDNWSKTKLQMYELIDSTRIGHAYMDYLLSRRSDEEYLDRYGMDYPDIHDPRKLSQTGAFSELAHVGLNFVSDNVKRLYR